MSRQAKKAAKARARRRAPANPDSNILWHAALMARWGISKQTLWRYKKASKVPAPDFHIGDRWGWKRKTIEDFESSGARS